MGQLERRKDMKTAEAISEALKREAEHSLEITQRSSISGMDPELAKKLLAIPFERRVSKELDIEAARSPRQ